MNSRSKIIRTWKGWTTPENAPVYEDLLVNEVFPTVKKNGVDGLEKVSISSKNERDEVEFFLSLQFDSLDSVKSFAGENYEIAYIPENAKRILKRYDAKAVHYELKKELIL
ncbi:antibiotic biosynthesis monooxygenase [Psychroflexus sp. CAK57W]|uniref:antibiotic biosynthesis monooxygenase n=1 Tax=Psychroflexus curvus TaxID=2873595 RepID=UPI001CCB23FC|nr:antibiotic biosynthesis monooxygenase [Psychroflexus curvus]MBZ9627534.1 antibiotic biosynthesis monooxygenase [Psychroflexus curvus]MBZ9786021.1 antibiotic biosynthesis monooxygenase [Psychroflexus curvus]